MIICLISFFREKDVFQEKKNTEIDSVRERVQEQENKKGYFPDFKLVYQKQQISLVVA